MRVIKYSTGPNQIWEGTDAFELADQVCRDVDESLRDLIEDGVIFVDAYSIEVVVEFEFEGDFFVIRND